jgi:hypothetical protein
MYDALEVGAVSKPLRADGTGADHVWFTLLTMNTNPTPTHLD